MVEGPIDMSGPNGNDERDESTMKPRSMRPIVRAAIVATGMLVRRARCAHRTVWRVRVRVLVLSGIGAGEG